MAINSTFLYLELISYHFTLLSCMQFFFGLNEFTNFKLYKECISQDICIGNSFNQIHEIHSSLSTKVSRLSTVLNNLIASKQ
ncbi:hypothetical protein QTP88_020183 [Uroleucon formosanum]